MIKLFVYGTLKKGEVNNILMGPNAKLIGEDYIKGELYIPEKVVSPLFALEGDGKVKGEIWEVDDFNFINVTLLEVSAGYTARIVETLNSKEQVIVYFYQDKKIKPYMNRIEDWNSNNV